MVVHYSCVYLSLLFCIVRAQIIVALQYAYPVYRKKLRFAYVEHEIMLGLSHFRTHSQHCSLCYGVKLYWQQHRSRQETLLALSPGSLGSNEMCMAVNCHRFLFIPLSLSLSPSESLGMRLETLCTSELSVREGSININSVKGNLMPLYKWAILITHNRYYINQLYFHTLECGVINRKYRFTPYTYQCKQTSYQHSTIIFKNIMQTIYLYCNFRLLIFPIIPSHWS